MDKEDARFQKLEQLHERRKQVVRLHVRGTGVMQIVALTGLSSMAGADTVGPMLRGAGFENVAFERHDCDICIGRDLDDAVDFAMALGPAGEIIRLAGEEGARRTPQVLATLREVLAPYVRPGGVWAPSSTWFITVSNPG